MYVLKSKYSDLDIPTDVSIAEFVLNKTQRYGNKPALIDGISGRVVTFSEFTRLVKAVGSGLFGHGFKKGDVLCVYAANCIEYPVIFHAVAAIGGIVTTCNPLYTSGELANQLRDSGAKYVVTQAPFINRVKEAVARSPKVQRIYSMGGYGGSLYEFEALMRDDGSRFPQVYIHPQEDVAVLPYSSGTTGKAKGVMLTHYNLVANSLQLMHPDIQLASKDDVYIGILPFYHIYSIMAVLNISLLAGATTIVLPHFELQLYLNVIQKYKATFLHIVPPIAVLLAKHPVIDSYNLKSVHSIFSGAAPLSVDTSELLMKRLVNIKRILQGYGMTETSPGIITSPSVGWKHGCVGMINANTYCKVVDIGTGAILGPHQEGEICCRGPQNMKGYLNNAEATRKTIDTDGWLHTGDIGYYDENEHFYIVDRLKELIKYKGFQVPPAELEGLLLSHPAIADAAVIGVPDEEAGELPRAYVVLKPGKIVMGNIVSKFVEGRVAHYKRLRGGVEFVKEIPKSAAGKILRRILKEQASHKLQSKL